MVRTLSDTGLEFMASYFIGCLKSSFLELFRRPCRDDRCPNIFRAPVPLLAPLTPVSFRLRPHIYICMCTYISFFLSAGLETVGRA